MSKEPHWPEELDNVVIVDSKNADSTPALVDSGQNGLESGNIGEITETIEIHLEELNLLNEEINKIQELILKCLENDGTEDGKTWLIQANKRLQQRVRKWVQQLTIDYKGMKDQLIKLSESASESNSSHIQHKDQNFRNILIVSKFTVFRKGIIEILKARPHIHVEEKSVALDSFDEIDDDIKIDLAIVHIPVITQRKIEQVKETRKMHPSMKLLLFVSIANYELTNQLVRCGCDAYLTDDSNEEQFLTAIDKVFKGDSYISLAISESLLMSWKLEELNVERRTLTEREKEVLKLIAEGKSSKAIGEKLCISVHTVDRHRANLMAKLNMNKVADLVKHAISTGIAEVGK
jgi:DNA-binding NarL/FixJ family response regulator